MESPASFLARNAVEVSPEGALKERLEAGRPLRVKLGLDPTAPDLHLGHTVVLQKLREFQDLGHTVVLIVGDYTARVGDPSGRSATRPVLSPEEIDAHAATYLAQATKVLADDERLEVRRNSEWLDMKMEELFRIVRTVTIARLLERDDFAKRMAAAEPISLLEFLYPVLQGYDSVAVRADVELGGTDQTFNLHMGRALQSSYGQPSQIVLTLPLLNGLDGTRKMSKSFGNQIGITDPPGEMYGKTLSIPDELIDSWYGLLLGTEAPADVGPRDAKRALARGLIERFHGAAEAAGGRGRVRPGLHRPGDARADRRGRALGQWGRAASAPGDGRAVRGVAIGSAAQAPAGRGQARRGADGGRSARRAGRFVGRPRHAVGQAPVPPNQNFFGETLVGREAAATLLHRGWGKQARPEPSGLCSGPRVR